VYIFVEIDIFCGGVIRRLRIRFTYKEEREK